MKRYTITQIAFTFQAYGNRTYTLHWEEQKHGIRPKDKSSWSVMVYEWTLEPEPKMMHQITFQTVLKPRIKSSIAILQAMIGTLHSVKEQKS